MQDNYTTKAKHLTIDSRRLIERWKKEGKSNREIASLLGKAPQTIHTEIKRGTVRQCLGKGRFKEVYSADYAQQSYENNRKRSVKKSSLTKELKEKILHYHNQKFSPEMMVTGLLSSLLNIRVVMQMKDHELQPMVKGRGTKTFKKWLDELITSLSERAVAEIGISYSGSDDWAKEMKESLQAYVEKPISVLETGSIIQTHTGENAWAILIRYHS
ncbi:DegV family protein [Streptococcus pneumoniae]|uniref:DegV family protein n=1 Tax=Streptococcus pneumoniae TaxID=1313 RepID=UPI0005E9BD9C|nr:DegV family protein [Streptococcus pneumoniae]CJR64369.1 IS1239%2C transposase [Streptococcus pneumoniae]